jgi:hypothetical protein
MGYKVNTWHPDGRSLSLDTTVNVNQTTQLNFSFSAQYSGVSRGDYLPTRRQPRQRLYMPRMAAAQICGMG